jgi:hypothetical protein
MPDVVAVRDASRTTMCHWSAALPVNWSSSQSRASCSSSLSKYLEAMILSPASPVTALAYTSFQTVSRLFSRLNTHQQVSGQGSCGP